MIRIYEETFCMGCRWWPLYIFIGFLFLFTSYSDKAQYLGDTITLESYEGEWKWESNDECLILYLRRNGSMLSNAAKLHGWSIIRI